MAIKEQNQAPRFERRWPVAVTILVVVGLLALLPGRIRLFPAWLPYVMGIAVLVPMALVGVTAAKELCIRAERTVTIFFFLLAGIGTLVNLANLIQAMVYKSLEISGLQLLTSSISVWIVNVLMFSLLYWQIDRGGPESRINHAGMRPDWLFPQEGASTDNVPPGWSPVFVDYLFLSYSTATAFSTTDVMPLTSRAKMMMMLESTISLMTIVVVASRAINILGN
jgi:uncharacterized membrane protein